MDKQQDAAVILKLYELRGNEEMRRARAWFFSQFHPTSAADIIALTMSGERESAYYRMVSSYWDMAASLVNNGAIDEKTVFSMRTPNTSSCSLKSSRFSKKCEPFSKNRAITRISNNS